jgi:hypothetical protein
VPARRERLTGAPARRAACNPWRAETALIVSPRPCTLVAELADRPSGAGEPLSPAIWECVIDEAAELGVIELWLAGDAPLRYAGLARLVARARARQLYTTLVTPAGALAHGPLAPLCAAGLDFLGVELGAPRAHPAAWTDRRLRVTAAGLVLPDGESVRDHPLAQIWERACERHAQKMSSLASASRISCS